MVQVESCKYTFSDLVAAFLTHRMSICYLYSTSVKRIGPDASGRRPMANSECTSRPLTPEFGFIGAFAYMVSYWRGQMMCMTYP